jgi:hypothetical protein
MKRTTALMGVGVTVALLLSCGGVSKVRLPLDIFGEGSAFVGVTLTITAKRGTTVEATKVSREASFDESHAFPTELSVQPGSGSLIISVEADEGGCVVGRGITRTGVAAGTTPVPVAIHVSRVADCGVTLDGGDGSGSGGVGTGGVTSSGGQTDPRGSGGGGGTGGNGGRPEATGGAASGGIGGGTG